MASTDIGLPPSGRHKKAAPVRAAFFVGVKENNCVVRSESSRSLRIGFTWHRAIFSGGYPPNIVAAAAFHNRVRDGSEWDHSAMDTRIVSILKGEP